MNLKQNAKCFSEYIYTKRLNHKKVWCWTQNNFYSVLKFIHNVYVKVPIFHLRDILPMTYHYEFNYDFKLEIHCK